MDSSGEQNLLMRAWAFVGSAPTKAYISVGLCAMGCALEDLNFIPKCLKCAVQDFSPFLSIQPDARHGTDITAYDITGISDRPALLPESLPVPLRTIVPRSLRFLSSAVPRCSSAVPDVSLPLCRGELAALQSPAGRNGQLAVLTVPW